MRLPAFPAEDGTHLGFAIATVCFASLTFAVLFAGVKLLGSGYSPFQVLLLRHGLGLVLSMPLLWRTGPALWRTDRPFSHVIRACYGQ